MSTVGYQSSRKEAILELLGEGLQARSGEKFMSLVADKRNMPSDMRKEFKESNGVWDPVELGSKKAQEIAYKLRLALGITWNPNVQKIYRIQAPQKIRFGRGVSVESWVRKEDLENEESLFGPGRGFKINNDAPKLFKTGRREDLEFEATNLQ